MSKHTLDLKLFIYLFYNGDGFWIIISETRTQTRSPLFETSSMHLNGGNEKGHKNPPSR